MKGQVDPKQYFNPAYDYKNRFASYWHQINEIVKCGSNSILEIGIGNGFVSNYLKQRGYSITSMDIEPKLSPNIVGTVSKVPFTDNSFDVVACFELLEHLPYSQFNPILNELFRISKKYVILSIPDASCVYRLDIQFPLLGEFRRLVPLPLKVKTHQFDGEHYWEIGKDGYRMRNIMNEIAAVGFEIETTYRVFEMPYHRFFALKKVKRCGDKNSGNFRGTDNNSQSLFSKIHS